MRMLAALLFGLTGVAFVCMGIEVLTGSRKRWILLPYWHYPPTKSAIFRAYLTGHFPGERLDCPTWGIANALILVTSGVLGIEVCFLMMLLPYLSPSQMTWGACVAVILLILTIVSPVGHRWFKSHWAYWLEENYKSKLDVLIADIRRDPRAWERRVTTQKGLEEWAREVAGEPRQEDQRRRQEQEKAIHSAIKSFSQGETFVIADLERACPGTSYATILRVLVQLRAQEKIECTGRGRTARWRRV